MARFYLNNNFERFAIRGCNKEMLEDFGPLDLLPEDSLLFNNNNGDPWEDFPMTDESKEDIRLANLKKTKPNNQGGFAKMFVNK